MVGSDTYFMEVSGHVSLKLATKDYLEMKKYLSKAKTKERNQKNQISSDKLGMILPSSITCFLEISAHVTLKVVTINSFRDKQTLKIYILRSFF